MKAALTLFFIFVGMIVKGQDSLGLVTGTVLDEKSKALEGTTVQLISLADTLKTTMVTTDGDGFFKISSIPFGYYRLRFSHVGLQPLTLDSIHFRAERYDFNLNDIELQSNQGTERMD